MSQVTLDQAKAIIAGAFAKGQALALKPLSVAVLDPGGHLIAFERQDGASTLRHAIATGKAAGALALGVSSRKIGDIAAERPSFVGALNAIAPAGVVPAAGGLIVVNANDAPLGAVGVTGDTSDNDELCAIAGIEAAELTYRP
ncbi:heme-binding protein [Sphingomonas bacterium]|uniref:GlcG/HbpS family heme-binding protein n=1 Tax=Sphingomonas bacterium TaxID=1895847 RepID=UPI00261ADF7E|nr:heme-binding protein [Sphingomonas bacterium]MDB5677925.1 GlcG protein [Sphingomonas bacterium]